MFGAFNDCQGCSTSKTSCFSRNHNLNMSTHCIFTYTTFKPYLVKLIASCVNSHTCSVIINTRENKIYFFSILSSFSDSIQKMLKSIICSNIHIICFDSDFGVDRRQCFLSCFNFRQSNLLRSVKQSVHVS